MSHVTTNLSPNVNSHSRRTRDDLRRRVVGAATARLEEVAVSHDIREAKVSELDVLGAVEKQVLRLEVAVHNHVAVAVLEA